MADDLSQFPTGVESNKTENIVAAAVTAALASAPKPEPVREAIVDPGAPAPEVPKTTPVPEPTAQAPATIPGATADAGLITPELLSRASRAGIPEAEANTLSPSTLRSIVERFESLEAPVQRAPSSPPAPEPEYNFDPVTGIPLRQQRGLPPLEDPPPAEDGTPQEWDPTVRKAFESRDQIISQLQQELAQVKQFQQQRVSAAQQEANLRDFNALEAQFAEDKDLHDLVGSGAADSCTKAQLQERQRMAIMMDSIRNTFASQRQRIPSIKEQYKMAKAALHSERIAKAAVSQAETDISRRAVTASEQFVRRPTAKGGAADKELPFGEERAIKNLDKLLAEQAAARNGA